MPVTRITVGSLEELLVEVLKIGRDLAQGRFLWYRGLSCSSYDLIPKIMRDGKTADEVFERELRLLTRFRQRSLAYWPSGYPQNEWEHLFAMQHYGMPTRLLDWSENLFVAAYFALQVQSAQGHKHRGTCTPAIWCVDPVEWNRSTPLLNELGDTIHVLTTADDELDSYKPTSIKRRGKSPIAIFGSHNSARIVAQRGTFMVWGNGIQPLKTFADLQTAQLWCFELSENRAELLQSLQLLGFGETMVFPELSSLSVELSRVEGWK